VKKKEKAFLREKEGKTRARGGEEHSLMRGVLERQPFFVIEKRVSKGGIAHETRRGSVLPLSKALVGELGPSIGRGVLGNKRSFW